MILLQSQSKYLLQLLTYRLQNLDKGVELDCQWIEFDDVRFNVQTSVKNPHLLLLSVSLPTPPPGAMFVGGLPYGAIEAIKAAYGTVVQILDPPKDGFNLTLKLNFSKLSPDEGLTSSSLRLFGASSLLDEKYGVLEFDITCARVILPEKYTRQALLMKVASVREVVLGAPLRVILKHLASRSLAPDMDELVSLVHRPNESFFLKPQTEKVTVVYPMRFKDSIDTCLATSFLQEFVEARRSASAGLNNAPSCHWSPSPPQELEGVPEEALAANAGFVSFVIFPRHVDSKKIDRTVWNLLTFHAYVSYHVKCSEGFMHTRMRRRVESLIETLDRAKSDPDKAKKIGTKTSFKRLSLKDSRSNANSRASPSWK